MSILWSTKYRFRFGLPVNFQAMLLHPNKKNTKKLRDVLQQLYGHLDSSAQSGAQGSHDVSTVFLFVVVDKKIDVVTLVYLKDTGYNNFFVFKCVRKKKFLICRPINVLMFMFIEC